MTKEECEALITRMREAIDNMFEAVEEGDAESIAHLAIRYKQLFGTKGEANEKNTSRTVNKPVDRPNSRQGACPLVGAEEVIR
jgi:hypothetical protein